MKIVTDLSVTSAPMRARHGWHPAWLFRDGAHGAWFDPADLTTLFQDSLGRTPVTAAGQLVGLMLDKSKGLARGPELITNGDGEAGPAVAPSDFLKGFTSKVQSADRAQSGTYSTKLTATAVSETHYWTLWNVPANTAVEISGYVYIPAGATAGQNIRAVDTSDGSLVQEIVPASSVDAWVYFHLIRPAKAVGWALALGNNISSNWAGASLYFDTVSLRVLPGNHAVQAVSAARPAYRTSGGLHWLEFDGVSDFMVTPTITPGTDKAQIFVGLRKLAPSGTDIVVELSSDFNANEGTFYFAAPVSAGTVRSYGSASRGTIALAAYLAGDEAPSPSTNVVSTLSDISGQDLKLRIDGTLKIQSVATQGAGNFLAYPLYIGMRGGSSLPFSGNIYGICARFGPNLTEVEIARTERYVAGKAGVVL